VILSHVRFWHKADKPYPRPPRLGWTRGCELQTVCCRLGCEPKDKPASVGAGLSAKQSERMFLQVVDRRPAEQRNGNDFGRQRIAPRTAVSAVFTFGLRLELTTRGMINHAR
jgi:hypothetical protein